MGHEREEYTAAPQTHPQEEPIGDTTHPEHPATELEDAGYVTQGPAETIPHTET